MRTEFFEKKTFDTFLFNAKFIMRSMKSMKTVLCLCISRVKSCHTNFRIEGRQLCYYVPVILRNISDRFFIKHQLSTTIVNYNYHFNFKTGKQFYRGQLYPNHFPSEQN